MKNLITACFLLASAGLFAQNKAGTLSIQPKAGVNIAALTQLDGTNPRTGAVLGAELEYQATDRFSVSAGLLYSEQGLKFDNAQVDGSGRAEGTIKMDYVSVPVLANIYVSRGLALKVGIQPAFLTNHKIRFHTDRLASELEIDGSSVKDIDLSLPVGISYCCRHFQLEARYSLGMLKVFSDEDVKNSVLQVTLGYKFKL